MYHGPQARWCVKSMSGMGTQAVCTKAWSQPMQPRALEAKTGTLSAGPQWAPKVQPTTRFKGTAPSCTSLTAWLQGAPNMHKPSLRSTAGIVTQPNVHVPVLKHHGQPTTCLSRPNANSFARAAWARPPAKVTYASWQLIAASGATANPWAIVPRLLPQALKFALA